MTNDDWQGRWKRGETGWHQPEVEPALIQHFSSIAPTTVFVPLCGKSLDLVWLASRGHQVIGAELSEVACLSFFEENGISFEKTETPGFVVYRSERITLFQGDFFCLQAEHLAGIGAIYDRAALIALPREIRARYAAHLIRLVHSCARAKEFRLLQIVLDRTPPDETGPPFSISADELTALYGTTFEIAPLSSAIVEAKAPVGSQTFERVYWLTFQRIRIDTTADSPA